MLNKHFTEFNRLMQGIERVYEEYAKSVGLTYMSLTVLEIICYTENPCTQKEICIQSHYNKQAVNSVIKDWCNKGYLHFAEVPDDRRNKFVCLTENGKAFADGVLGPLRELEQRALSVLSDDEWETILKMLKRCYSGYVQS